MMVLELFGVRPTVSRFAARLLAAIAADGGADWSFDPAEGTLLNTSGSSISLHNIFLEYCAQKPWSRQPFIKKYADLANAASQKIPELWEAAAKAIYPVVRSMYVDGAVLIRNRATGVPPSPAMAFDLVGDLQIRLMYDFGNTLCYVTHDQLAIWGQQADDVLQRAVANLGRLEQSVWVDSGRGFYQIAAPMSFGESMLLLDSVVNALPFAEFAVVLPCNRGILLAADGRSSSALQALLHEALRCNAEEPWPMTGTLCMRVGGSWQEFVVDEKHVQLAHSLFTLNRAEYYAGQRSELDALNDLQEKDMFNAAFTVFGERDKWESYCVWSEGIASSLPVTDWVFLVSTDEAIKATRVSWQRLMDVCGDLLRGADESPPRYEATSFPTTEQIGTMA